ncbi:MAG: DUF202 domain-containing protein [Solirubrobacteraceae bacterium]
MSPSGSQTSAGDPSPSGPELDDPGLARDRTALAWTRSALNMAASGTLIAHAGFAAHLDALGVATAIAMATMALLTWRHGQMIYRARGLAGTFPHQQPGALGALTAATLLTASIAIVMTITI